MQAGAVVDVRRVEGIVEPRAGRAGAADRAPDLIVGGLVVVAGRADRREDLEPVQRPVVAAHGTRRRIVQPVAVVAALQVVVGGQEGRDGCRLRQADVPVETEVAVAVHVAVAGGQRGAAGRVDEVGLHRPRIAGRAAASHRSLADRFPRIDIVGGGGIGMVPEVRADHVAVVPEEDARVSRVAVGPVDLARRAGNRVVFDLVARVVGDVDL